MHKALAIAMILGILTIAPQRAVAQRTQNTSVVTGAVGYSLIGIFSGFDNNAHTAVRSTPVFQFCYDYAVVEGLSIGAGGSYQEFIHDYEYYYPSGAYENYSDRFTRANIGARVLAHFSESEKVDLYAGGRVGYTIWDSGSNNPTPGYRPSEYAPELIRASYNGIHYTTQGIFGFRYFLVPNFGLGAEVSLGAPGFFMIGLQGRF
jgi:hypothetical protein